MFLAIVQVEIILNLKRDKAQYNEYKAIAAKACCLDNFSRVIVASGVFKLLQTAQYHKMLSMRLFNWLRTIKTILKVPRMAGFVGPMYAFILHFV